MKPICYAGIALGGGKNDRTSFVTIESFAESRRIFVRSVYDKVPPEGGRSGDTQLISLVDSVAARVVAIDAPLQLPKCLRCDLPCPGSEKCELPAIRWLRGHAASSTETTKVVGKKRLRRERVTPYTQRCVELWISRHLEEKFYPSDALGSNAAPLTARAHYLQRRLAESKLSFIEYFPKLSLWRLGRSLGMTPAKLRSHRHVFSSESTREEFLKQMTTKGPLFIYQQDLKHLVERPQPFDALLGALSAHLEDRGENESPPEKFPRGEEWIAYPKMQFEWFPQRKPASAV